VIDMITANGRFEDDFLAIICGDNELIRAEFEDLVAAEGFVRPPPPP
jgi:hypothetical protein